MKIAALNTALNTGQNMHSKAEQLKRLKEQTDEFESFMIKQVLDTSMDSKNSEKLYGKDPGDRIYKAMQNDAFSKALAGDLGFSKMLYDFLKEKI